MAVDRMIAGSGGGKAGGGSGGISESPDDLSSTLNARFVDLIGEGEIVGLVNNEFSIYLDGVPLKALSGTPNYRPFRYSVVNGQQTQDVLSGFVGTQQENSVGLQVVKSTGMIIRSVADADADAVRVTVSVQGLSETDTKGKIAGSSVEFSIHRRLAGGTWELAKATSIKGKTTSKYQRSYEVKLSDLGPGPYEVAVERTKDDSASGLIVDGLYWDSFTVINYEKFTYPNSALIGVEIDARYFNSIPERRYHVRGLRVRVPMNYDPVTRKYATSGAGTTGGAWDGSFKVAYTDNPAWCYYDLVTNKRYGLGNYVSDAQVDKWSLYEIGKYCDQLVPSGLANNVFGAKGTPSVSSTGKANAGVVTPTDNVEPRFRLNCVINTQEQAYKLLNQLTSVFWGMTYWGNSTVTVTQDRPTAGKLLYTNSNVEDGRFSYEGSGRSQRHSVAIVAWNDPSEDFKQKFEYVEDREAIARYGLRPTELVAFGCTSRSQARRLGLWTLYTERLEREVVRFRVGYDSALVMPGEVCKIADRDYAGARWGGRVVAATTTSITLDKATNFPIGDYTFSVMLPSGTFTTRTVSWATEAERTVITFGTAMSETPLVGAIWTAESEVLQPRLARVVAIKQDGDFFEITAIEHNPSKYAAIETGVGYEEYGYSIISYDQVPAITGLSAVETSYTFKDTRDFVSRIEVSWDALDDATIRGYIVGLRGSDGTYTEYPETKANSLTIEGVQALDYTVGVRAVNALGISGLETRVTLTVTAQDERNPPTPTGVACTTQFATYTITFTAPSYVEGGGHLHAEIWTNTTNTTAGAVRAGTTVSTRFLYTGKLAEQRYFWVRHVARNKKVSSYSASTNGTTQQVTSTDIATDAVTSDKILGGAISPTKFASGIEPITLVTGALPTTKSTNTIYRTDDGKLYRWNGTAYIASIPTSDLTGYVGAALLEADSVIAGKVAAGAINTRELAAQAVTASKVVVADFSNLVPDPNFLDPSLWTGLTIEPSGSTTFDSQNYVSFTGTAGAYSAFYATKPFPVEAGRKYLFRAQGRLVSGTGEVKFYIRWYTDNTFTSHVENSYTVISNSTTIGEGTVQASPPAGYRYASLVFYKENTGTATGCRVGGLVVRRGANAELIVDGSVTALKVEAGLFQADNVLTRNLTVRDASGNIILAAGVPLSAANFGGTVGGGNLLPNSSFELDSNNDGVPDNWTGTVNFGTGVTITRTLSTAVPLHGLRHLLLTVTAISGATQNRHLVSCDPVTVIENQKYYLSAWMRAGHVDYQGDLSIGWFDNTDTLIGTYFSLPAYTFSAAAKWERLGGVVTSPAGAVSARVRAGLRRPSNEDTRTTTMRIEAVQLELGDVPSSYAPSSVDKVGIDNPINSANIGVYMAAASIGWAQIGDLQISTTGAIWSGQSAFNSGTGYRLEYNGGTPRLSIGVSTGNRLTWDGSDLIVVAKSSNFSLLGVPPQLPYVGATQILNGANGTASAEVAVKTNGTVTRKSGTGSAVVAGNWYNPTTTNIGNTHWVRFTVLSGLGPGGVTINTWLALTTDRIPTLSQTSTGLALGAVEEKTSTLLYEIADDSSGSNILGSGTLNIYVRRSNEP